MVLKLTSPIPPSVNHYLSYRCIVKNGRAIGMSYKTPEALRYRKNFAKYVAEEVKRQNWDMTPNHTQHFYIDTIFYFPTTNLDGNNYFKVLLDAITDTQLIWLDDNVACERIQAIYYDAENPRVELEIKPVDYIGIFEDASQLDDFRSNCVECNRYARNCRVLQNAIAGRIQPEINNLICSAFNKRKTKKNATNKNGKKGTEHE